MKLENTKSDQMLFYDNYLKELILVHGVTIHSSVKFWHKKKDRLLSFYPFMLPTKCIPC